MSGTKYVLKNNTTLAQFFDYKTLSDAMWNYQVQLNPGQIKTIWAETGTLKIYNNGAITIEEQSAFPPTDHVIGGNNGTTTHIDYTNKSILVFAKLPNSNNLGYSILDFDNNVIVGPVDLGYDTSNIPSGYWYVDDIYPFTNSGYAIYLTNDDNCNKAAIYLDYRGTVIGQYSASTCDRQYGMFNGQYSYFTDNVNGIIVYSDGKRFNSFEFNTDYVFYVDNNYNGCTKDGFIVYSKLGTYTSYTIVTMDGLIPLTNWNDNYASVTMFEYANSNFYTTLNYSDGDGTYLSLNIYSSNGAILHTINLTQDYQLNSQDLTFFGTNKVNIIFYNDGNNTIPYVIYTYDGETNTLISTTHPNDGNYTDWSQDYDELYGGGNNYPSQDFHINFYNIIDSNYYLRLANYYDILSYFSGDTEYRNPYVINNNTTTNWVSIFESFRATSLIKFYTDNDNILKLLVITSEGTSLVNVTPLGPLDTYQFTYWSVGDIFIFMTYTNYSSDGTIYAYDAMGNQLDYKLFYNNWNNAVRYGTFYLEADSANINFYFNLKDLKFTSVNENYNWNTIDNYYTSTFKGNGNIVLFRFPGNFYARLLSENTLTPEVQLPTPNCCYFDLRVGKDVILYTYVNDSGYLTINLYNTSLGLLKSLTTNISDWNNIYTYIVENRASVAIYYNGQFINYMVSTNGIKSVELTTNNDWYVPNDNYWWD